MSKFEIGSVTGTNVGIGDEVTITTGDVIDLSARIDRLIDRIGSSDLPEDARKNVLHDAEELRAESRGGRRRERMQALLAQIVKGSRNVAAITGAVAEVEQAVRHLG